MKKIATILLLSLFFISGGVGHANAASPQSTENALDANTLLQPIVNLFQSIFDLMKAPFVALQEIIYNWSGSVSSIGIWAPVVAVGVLILTLFVLYVGIKGATYLP